MSRISAVTNLKPLNNHAELGNNEASSVQSGQVFSFDQNQLRLKNYYQAVNRWLKALSERGAKFAIQYNGVPVDGKLQELAEPEFEIKNTNIKLRYFNGTKYPRFEPTRLTGSFSITVKFPVDDVINPVNDEDGTNETKDTNEVEELHQDSTRSLAEDLPRMIELVVNDPRKTSIETDYTLPQEVMDLFDKHTLNLSIQDALKLIAYYGGAQFSQEDAARLDEEAIIRAFSGIEYIYNQRSLLLNAIENARGTKAKKCNEGSSSSRVAPNHSGVNTGFRLEELATKNNVGEIVVAMAKQSDLIQHMISLVENDPNPSKGGSGAIVNQVIELVSARNDLRPASATITQVFGLIYTCKDLGEIEPLEDLCCRKDIERSGLDPESKSLLKQALGKLKVGDGLRRRV